MAITRQTNRNKGRTAKKSKTTKRSKTAKGHVKRSGGGGGDKRKRGEREEGKGTQDGVVDLKLDPDEYCDPRSVNDKYVCPRCGSHQMCKKKAITGGYPGPIQFICLVCGETADNLGPKKIVSVAELEDAKRLRSQEVGDRSVFANLPVV